MFSVIPAGSTITNAVVPGWNAVCGSVLAVAKEMLRPEQFCWYSNRRTMARGPWLRRSTQRPSRPVGSKDQLFRRRGRAYANWINVTNSVSVATTRVATVRNSTAASTPFSHHAVHGRWSQPDSVSKLVEPSLPTPKKRTAMPDPEQRQWPRLPPPAPFAPRASNFSQILLQRAIAFVLRWKTTLNFFINTQLQEALPRLRSKKRVKDLPVRWTSRRRRSRQSPVYSSSTLLRPCRNVGLLPVFRTVDVLR